MLTITSYFGFLLVALTITLGIPTICLIDTNCDPDLGDISIPANGDALSSIQRFIF